MKRTLQFTLPEFIECPTCAAKCGSPILCRECLERRELHGWAMNNGAQICKVCVGNPDPYCKEHGR